MTKHEPLVSNFFYMINIWKVRFERVRLFGWLALAGLPFMILAAFTTDIWRTLSIVGTLLLILPGFVYVYVIVILHWKDRYRGRHSDLWGVLILIETSGWMKLVYIFRHLVPDMRQAGRYRAIPDSPPSTPSIV